MDRMRTRRTSFKSQQPSLIKETHEIFYPTVKRAEDPTNRTLHILLPGFKREEIKVQLDNAGKVVVKGSRQLADNRFLDVKQSFEVPRDTITERISGRFEDGILTLVMPKKREVEEEEEEEKAATPQPQPEPVSEPSQQEKPKQAPKESEGMKDEEAIQREPKPRKEKQEEDIKEADHVKKEEAGEKKKHETLKEKPKHETNTSNETRRKEQAGVGEEEKSQIEKQESDEEEDSMKEEEEKQYGWMDSISIDSVVGTIKRNKKLTATAVVAFSVGFYVSRKLSKS